MTPVINIGIYEAVWLLCVLLENTGALTALPLLGLHLFLTPRRRPDLFMMALMLATGLVVDGALHAAGVLAFNTGAKPIPVWLAVVWLALGTLPHHSLAWMKHRHGLCALFGAVGGPLAYWGGVRLGAATFGLGTVQSLFILAAVWAVLWPCVMLAAAADEKKRQK